MPGNKGFKYVYSLGHISDVLQKIQNTGRPDKLTFSYMRDSWLLKNAQYSAVLDLLTDMGFIDSTGTPTSVYAAYQNPSLSKAVLAQGIKNAYPTLFKAYPNANNLDKESLEGYIKQQTGADQSVLDKTVRTFIKLCSLADFSGGAPSDSEVPVPSAEKPSSARETLIPISMNIQIIIPSDATDEQYDRIFSSIKRFLTK
ncbi:MAG: DUF5343 domain-containing protein [Anaerolineaceae bacterium]|nr:DUF5343 domain-containing protein [Anaerolineaceae bacterium]